MHLPSPLTRCTRIWFYVH